MGVLPDFKNKSPVWPESDLSLFKSKYYPSYRLNKSLLKKR